MPVDPVAEFLLWYVVTHKCGALFNHLTDKEKVITFAARGVLQEMPSYEYRMLLSAWRNLTYIQSNTQGSTILFGIKRAVWKKPESHLDEACKKSAALSEDSHLTGFP